MIFEMLTVVRLLKKFPTVNGIKTFKVMSLKKKKKSLSNLSDPTEYNPKIITHILTAGPRFMLPSTPPWHTGEWTGVINGNMYISELD
jgi:hypothetical protein